MTAAIAEPTEAGFYPGLSFEAYCALDGINVSSLTPMAISAKHYRYFLDSGRPEKPSFALGHMAHCALLEPERFERERAALRESVALYDGARNPKHAKYQEFIAANPGKRIVILSEYNELLGEASTAVRIRDAVLADPVARRYLEAPGPTELTARWLDRDTGLLCKARLDKLLGDFLVADLKTSRHAVPRRFCSQAAALGYHVRLAFYVDGVAAITGRTPPAVLVVVEKEPPHDVTCYPVGAEELDAGRRVYRGLLDRVAECLDEDRWPGAAGGREHELKLPQWAYEEGIADSLIVEGEEVQFA